MDVHRHTQNSAYLPRYISENSQRKLLIFTTHMVTGSETSRECTKGGRREYLILVYIGEKNLDVKFARVCTHDLKLIP